MDASATCTCGISRRDDARRLTDRLFPIEHGRRAGCLGTHGGRVPEAREGGGRRRNHFRVERGGGRAAVGGERGGRRRPDLHL
jgi:hypothetical protein